MCVVVCSKESIEDIGRVFFALELEFSPWVLQAISDESFKADGRAVQIISALLHTVVSTFLVTSNRWPLALETNPSSRQKNISMLPRCQSVDFLFLCFCLISSFLGQNRNSLLVLFILSAHTPSSSNNKHRKLLSPGRTGRSRQKNSLKLLSDWPFWKRAVAWPLLSRIWNICWVWWDVG